MTHICSIGDVRVGSGPLTLIAGPCVIESENMCLEIAAAIKQIADAHGFPFIFKASFDKANRTSLGSFRGPGLDEGLQILSAVKNTVGIPILTDVHDTTQIAPIAEVADAIQIPAFLSRQTDLLVAAGHSGKTINLKKGQFLAPEDMRFAIDKVTSTGNENIMVSERGTSFGYHDLVVDMRALEIMRAFGHPVVFDATHAVQQPSAAGGASSGQREFVPALIRGAVAVGIDGLFLEVHPKPDEALSDGPNMITPTELGPILTVARSVHDAIQASTQTCDK